MPRFVLQQHDATTRHFDLRLEVDGVLRSWAVPKGPSLDPAHKRLAMAVADHDLAAGDFEGRHAGATRGSGAVIVGHSERREVFGETDEVVARKTVRAISAGLLPVVCVGETKEERDAGSMWDKVSGQIRAVFEQLDASKIGGEDIAFAYEPIWAIGTGETATPEDAQDAIGRIRSLLREIGGEDIAEEVRILYGGSVKPGNVGEIMAQQDVDGGLVGGASLEAETFAKLVNGAANGKGV